MVKMIAVDMDGTFLSSAKDYNRARFQRLYQKMQEQDVKFVVASGNQYYQLTSFFADIAADISFVAENGALVISEGDELLCGKLKPALITEVLAFLDSQQEVRVILCGRHSAYVRVSEPASFITQASQYYHRLATVADFKTLPADVLFKFALHVPIAETEQRMAAINERFSGRIKAVTSGHGDIDLIIPGLHKANGLRVLQEKWQIRAEDIAAFGDGGNDLEMLSHVGQSYAMENGSAIVRATAKYIAPRNDAEGVLTVMEELLEK
ncbi:Cof-type HAD-IIB family hydrolase [Brochothrix campestris]|uniref:Cof family hydrolase n=1 Tax=Brochothrix campestris FSL F6-1037 TaxID=1265861 RepID=W7CQS9_9LIST|nr:Cof-type HAD-IIB family hydrolase [Brochothrix campestris]EUJ42004.1 cof family hydrolase [Brochothrix campestris FSL F6-1037]